MYLCSSGDQNVLKSHLNLSTSLTVPSKIRFFFQIKPYCKDNRNFAVSIGLIMEIRISHAMFVFLHV